jgi:hypothetical protein
LYFVVLECFLSQENWKIFYSLLVLCALQAAAASMFTELANEHRFDQLHGMGEGWLRFLALMLHVEEHLAGECDMPVDWHIKLAEVLSEALRCCSLLHFSFWFCAC